MKIKVLNHGYVKLIEQFGNEDFVSKIAGMSRENGEPSLKNLIKWGHYSPLEWVHITFEIYMPIYIQRQFVRHRSIKILERSMRYVVPKELHFDSDSPYGEDFYRSLIRDGKAPEDARKSLPLNTYVLFYCQIDLRHLLSYLKLRDDKHAQEEHIKYAKAIRKIAINCFPSIADIDMDTVDVV